MPSLRRNKSIGNNRAALFPARLITYISIFTAVAFVLSTVDSLVPIPAPAPGFKLGLANIVTLILLIKNKSPLCAIIVTLLRCLLGAAASGVLSSLLFSLTGGLVSCIVMWFLLHFNYPISLIGVSVAGAFFHNAGQLAAAALIARNAAVFSYLPVLAITGTAAGCATGYAALRIQNIIPKL